MKLAVLVSSMLVVSSNAFISSPPLLPSSYRTGMTSSGLSATRAVVKPKTNFGLPSFSKPAAASKPNIKSSATVAVSPKNKKVTPSATVAVSPKNKKVTPKKKAPVETKKNVPKIQLKKKVPVAIKKSTPKIQQKKKVAVAIKKNVPKIQQKKKVAVTIKKNVPKIQQKKKVAVKIKKSALKGQQKSSFALPPPNFWKLYDGSVKIGKYRTLTPYKDPAPVKRNPFQNNVIV